MRGAVWIESVLQSRPFPQVFYLKQGWFPFPSASHTIAVHSRWSEVPLKSFSSAIRPNQRPKVSKTIAKNSTRQTRNSLGSSAVAITPAFESAAFTANSSSDSQPHAPWRAMKESSSQSTSKPEITKIDVRYRLSQASPTVWPTKFRKESSEDYDEEKQLPEQRKSWKRSSQYISKSAAPVCNSQKACIVVRTARGSH